MGTAEDVASKMVFQTWRAYIAAATYGRYSEMEKSVRLRTHVVKLIVDTGACQIWSRGGQCNRQAGAKESDPLPRRSIILVYKVAACIASNVSLLFPFPLASWRGTGKFWFLMDAGPVTKPYKLAASSLRDF